MHRALRIVLSGVGGLVAAGLVLGAAVPALPDLAGRGPVIAVAIACVVGAVCLGEWLARPRRE